MLHLFKRVYLERDSVIDIHQDRIVISHEHGYPTIDELGARGELIAYAKSVDDIFGPLDGEQPYSSLTEMLLSLVVKQDETEKPIFIYCDKEAFLWLSVAWFKSLLPYAGPRDAFNIMKAYWFKVKMFHSYRDRDRAGPPFEFTPEEWWEAWNDIQDDSLADPKFIKSIHHAVSVEFQLASYLFDGSLENDLKRTLIPLVRKDAVSWLSEIKEVIAIHAMNNTLRKELGITEDVTLDNFESVVTNASPPYDVFFDPDLWTIPDSIATHESNPIRFENLTTENIEKITETIKLISKIFPALNDFTSEIDGVSKLDFLRFLQDDEFSSTELNTILKYEASDRKYEGLFHSINQTSVNTFLVDYILDRGAASDTESISPYRLI